MWPMAQRDEHENAIVPEIDSSMCYFINKDVKQVESSSLSI